MDKNFYNEASGARLGWDPSWFGERFYDDKLTRAVKKYQRSRGLHADGMCGPATFRRLWTDRQENIDDHVPETKQYSNYIVYNGNFTAIDWDKVVLWSEPGAPKARKGTYYDYTGRPKRKIRYFVNHWDVCLSSHSCQRVLDRRGISVHFLIDNDGTIYQTMDIQHAAWHAGSERTNRPSIGVEITNAYYPKYQNWYKRHGHGERPVVDKAFVNGNEIGPFLGFYPKQLEALKALWKAVGEATGIPLQTPVNQFGNTSKNYEQHVAYGRYEGIVSHYHISKNKIDCAGLDIKSMIDEIKEDT